MFVVIKVQNFAALLLSSVADLCEHLITGWLVWLIYSSNHQM